MRGAHAIGLDVLGATQSERAVLIRVRNAPELVRKAGAVASLAQTLFPTTLDSKVYSEMATKLAAGLKAEGVDADVRVVEPAGWQRARGIISWPDAAVGAAVVIMALLVWNLFRWRHSFYRNWTYRFFKHRGGRTRRQKTSRVSSRPNESKNIIIRN